jgi:hypothetical protein
MEKTVSPTSGYFALATPEVKADAAGRHTQDCSNLDEYETQ